MKKSMDFWSWIWYNVLKPTAVERRRIAFGNGKLPFSYETVERLKPPCCDTVTASPQKDFVFVLWYNVLKPTAVERRRNAFGIGKRLFSFVSIEWRNLPHCGVESGFTASQWLRHWVYDLI